VTKTILPTCQISLGSGCGDGFEHGLGYTYKIYFVGSLASDPIVKLVDIKFLGGTVVDGAIGKSKTMTVLESPHNRHIERYLDNGCTIVML
jgi:hypothetical protein